MNRPAEVDQLLSELRAENPHSNVTVATGSKLIIVVEDIEARYQFDGPEARLLLSGPQAVDRLFEALAYPNEVFVELHELVVDQDVTSELENFASTVDEM